MNRLAKAMLTTTGVWLALLCSGGCKHTVAIEPIEIRPIHITVDINVRVEERLNNFFDFEREFDTAPGAKPTSDLPQDVQ